MSAITYGLGGSNLLVTYGLGVGGVIPPAGSFSYLMRAYKFTAPTQFVYWQVEDAPDATATFAPFPAGELSDIVVVSEIVSSGSVGSGSLQEAYDVGATINLASARDFVVTQPTVGTASVLLQSNSTSKFEVISADLNLYTTTAGNLNLYSATSASVNIGATADEGAVNIATSGQKHVTIGNGSASVSFGDAVAGAQDSAPVGYALKSSGTGQFSKGDVVHVDVVAGTPTLKQSLASGVGVQREVIGVALAGDVAPITRVATLTGTVVEVAFDAAPAATDPGKPVYLSVVTAGTASMNVPTVPGHRIYRLGTLLDAVAGTNGGYFVALNLRSVANL